MSMYDVSLLNSLNKTKHDLPTNWTVRPLQLSDYNKGTIQGADHRFFGESQWLEHWTLEKFLENYSYFYLFQCLSNFRFSTGSTYSQDSWTFIGFSWETVRVNQMLKLSLKFVFVQGSLSYCHNKVTLETSQNPSFQVSFTHYWIENFAKKFSSVDFLF